MLQRYQALINHAANAARTASGSSPCRRTPALADAVCSASCTNLYKAYLPPSVTQECLLWTLFGYRHRSPRTLRIAQWCLPCSNWESPKCYYLASWCWPAKSWLFCLYGRWWFMVVDGDASSYCSRYFRVRMGAEFAVLTCWGRWISRWDVSYSCRLRPVTWCLCFIPSLIIITTLTPSTCPLRSGSTHTRFLIDHAVTRQGEIASPALVSWAFACKQVWLVRQRPE